MGCAVTTPRCGPWQISTLIEAVSTPSYEATANRLWSGPPSVVHRTGLFFSRSIHLRITQI